MTDTRQVLTPWEALRRFEREWGDELAAVTLAGELDVPHTDAAQILKTLIRLQRRYSRVLEDHPACLVVSLSSCARRVYRGGALWDALFDLVELPRQHTVEAQLGNAFVEALDVLDKPTPAHSHFRFVSAMALHACIPDYCISDLMGMLAARQEASPGIDGSSFVAWATGLGGSARLERLDRPVRDFLTAGNDFVVDLVDRLLDLLSRLRRGERDPDALLSSSGVPSRFVKWATENVDHTFALHPLSSFSAEAPQLVLPHIVLDLERWCVLLRLPAVAEHDRAWWNVTVDGDSRRVQSMPRNGLSDSAAPSDMVVDAPTRSLGVALGTSEHRYDLDVIDASAPAVAFDDQGTFVPMGVPLPQSEVWLLHPEDSDKFELRFDGDGCVTSEAIGPIGWAGWCLSRVDLGHSRAMLINGVSRPVRRSVKARLVAEEPLSGVRTSDGGAVVARRPTIDVPMSTVDHDWTLEVRDAETGTTLESHVWTIPALSAEDSDVAVIDPFDEWPAPLVGSFEVLARGPLGSRSRWRLNVCEGLRAVPSVECRTFVPGGLTPMKVRLDSATGLKRSPVDIDFGRDDLTSRSVISGAGRSMTVEVEPPHLEVCRSYQGGTTDWSSQPLILPTDASEPLGSLQVRMPSREPLPPLTLSTPDGLQQTLASHKGGARGLYRFELARLADTLAATKSGDLGWDFGTEQTILIRFQPEQIASAATLVDGNIVLDDFSSAPGVVGGAYFRLAPWRAPVVMTFAPEGVATCPPGLLAAGPLSLELRIDDPWVPAPWDRWPTKAMRLWQDGRPQSHSPAEAAVISFLAQESPAPREEEALPFLWELVELIEGQRSTGFLSQGSRDVTAALRNDPHAATRALAAARVSKRVGLRTAIRLGLVEQRLAIGPDESRALWDAHPAIGACATVEDGHPVDAIVRQCGESAAALLRGDDDPHALAGRFTESLRMDALPQSAIEGMLEAGGIIPAALLDRDTRAKNAEQLFAARKHWSLTRATKYPQRAIDAAIKTISGAGYPTLATAITQRAEPSIHRPWQRLPQMSLLMAGLARVGSRGSASAIRVLDEVREAWADMTQTASTFIEMDIVLAEMLVSSDTVRRAQTDQEEETNDVEH